MFPIKPRGICFLDDSSWIWLFVFKVEHLQVGLQFSDDNSLLYLA